MRIADYQAINTIDKAKEEVEESFSRMMNLEPAGIPLPASSLSNMNFPLSALFLNSTACLEGALVVRVGYPLRLKEEQVHAHILICLLACNVEWQLRRVSPPLFDNEIPPADRETLNPISPVKPSPEAMKK